MVSQIKRIVGLWRTLQYLRGQIAKAQDENAKASEDLLRQLTETREAESGELTKLDDRTPL